MRSFGITPVTLVLGIVIVAGSAAHSQLKQAVSAVHAAPVSKIVTVTLTELHRTKHHKDVEQPIAQAVGFRTDTCDVVTTFDVVKEYEKRQTWTNIRQRLDIVIDGKSYPAKFRDLGYYPLGLNLACIDFESPAAHADLQIPVLPLEEDTSAPSVMPSDDNDTAKLDPGTPFLNKEGEITAVLVATSRGHAEFASADDIRRFLLEAEGIPAWPVLQRRELTTI